MLYVQFNVGSSGKKVICFRDLNFQRSTTQRALRALPGCRSIVTFNLRQARSDTLSCSDSHDTRARQMCDGGASP